MSNNSSIAQALISTHTSLRGYGSVNTETLGKHLAQQVLSYLLVVYEVFLKILKMSDYTN
jgi:hypothetical protein